MTEKTIKELAEELGVSKTAINKKVSDENRNGWIGFYYQRGYDAAGRVVATRYSTL
ncbi:hypothetical protein [Enterococcus sp. DIV0436a]|uniref:hypothetical protein n=1 Tax=Enterococcus sp. DIV0436a TaxID=2774918 RepID=UPI003F270D43